jgi:hypothetical protein
MFRPSFLDHHQVVYLIQGNYTICDIKSLVFNEISSSSINFFFFFMLGDVITKDLL